MPRPNISASMLTAIQSSSFQPALLVEMHFVSGVSYVWNGRGTLSWNSHSWLGVGNFGSISVIEEGATVSARGITLALSGIDASMLADALQEMQVGLPAVVYLGIFDPANPGVLFNTPLTSWAGRMDQPTIDVDGTTASISINCENRLVVMDVAVDRRYTNDDQQIDHPGDLGFQFVNSIQEQTVYFGRTPNGSNV